MNKQDLIDSLADQHPVLTKHEAEAVVDHIFSKIESAVVAGDKVSIAGFGIFEKKVRKGRVGRNPRTGESVTIPAMGIVKFRPTKAFKDASK